MEERKPSRLAGRIDTFCARAIMLVFMAILTWGPLAYGAKYAGGFLVIQGLTIVALALWGVRLWVQRPFRLLWPPVCWAVLAFLLYALGRCQFVVVEDVGRQQLLRVLVYGALFFLAVNNLNRTKSATIVTLTLIVLGFFLSMLAIFQMASHYPWVWDLPKLPQYKDRGSGTFMNPNHLAAFLGMTVPLALAFTVMGRFSATQRVLLGYSAITMLAGIAVSISRGGMIAAAIALTVFCGVLLAQRDFWKPALVLLGLLALAGVIAYSQFDSIQKRFGIVNGSHEGGDERMCYWRAAWQLFAKEPAWGIGPGHFDIEFPSVRTWQVQDRPNYVHNDYLNTLCEWGATGLFLVAAACGLLYWSVFEIWSSFRRSSRELASGFSDRNAFIVGAGIAMLTVMLHCFVEFNMQVASLAVTAISLMALLAAHMRFVSERYWRNPGTIGKILLTVLIAAVIAHLSTRGLPKGRETYWLDQAAKASVSDTPDSVIACAIKAHEAEPADREVEIMLADYLWQLSLDAGPGELERAQQARTWYEKSASLNPFDPYAPLGCGLCLDQMGQTDEATPYFVTAMRKGPHDCYVALQIARHCLELGQVAAAREWMEHGSLRSEASPSTLAEWDKLLRDLDDPVYLAGAEMIRTNKTEEQKRAMAPILEGPK